MVHISSSHESYIAEYKYNKDTCQQDRPKGVTHIVQSTHFIIYPSPSHIHPEFQSIMVMIIWDTWSEEGWLSTVESRKLRRQHVVACQIPCLSSDTGLCHSLSYCFIANDHKGFFTPLVYTFCSAICQLPVWCSNQFWPSSEFCLYMFIMVQTLYLCQLDFICVTLYQFFLVARLYELYAPLYHDL